MIAVEFAVVLPVIVLLLVGSIEMARAVMVAHALQEAAQAACRVYSVEGTTKSQAEALVAKAMSHAEVTDYAVTYEPASKSGVDVPLEPVTVTVTASYSKIAWLPPTYLGGATLQGVCVMPADLDISDGGDQNGYKPTDDDFDGDGNERHDERPSGDDDDD